MGLRILLIDNDRLILEQLQDGLQEAGHEVFRAMDGMEGLQQLREKRPDAVLLDLVLPKIDGFRFCQYVREDQEFGRLPLIAISAVSRQELQRALEFGATAAVTKEPIQELLPKLLVLLNQFTKIPDMAHQSPAAANEITKELLQERTRFLTLLNAMPEGLLELDSEHRIIYMNAAASRMLQQAEASAAGKNFRELFEPAIQSSISDMLARITSGAIASIQADFDVDGRTLRIILNPLPTQGTFAGSISIIQDVTSEKNQLIEEKSRTKSIIESMPDGVVLVNMQGDVILINQAAKKILRLSRREDNLNVKALEESLHCSPFDLTRGFTKGFPSQLTLHEEIRVFERMLALNISPVFDAEGTQTGTAIVMRDVTDQKAQEERRNEFLSVISHELRTPLASIRGSLDLVFKEVLGPLAEKQRRYLELARASCEKLNNVIGDLLDLSKFEKGRMEIKLGPVMLNRIVDEVVERFQPYAMEKGASIKFSYPETEAQVYGDGNRLIQVLNNLMSNAVKYTPPAGKIEVELFVPAIMPPQVGVSVKDSGPGIRPEDLDQIFDKYGKPYPSAGPGGTGLGLAISRSIIEAHRGKIWAESTPGKGAKFIFILPVEKRSGPHTEVYAELVNFSRREELDALVVSADDAAGYALKGILMERRFRVMLARNTEEAQSALRERTPHLLVADLDADSSIIDSWIDFLEHDAETEKIPVILFSQNPQRIRPRANVLTGTKPIDAHQFLQLLPEALMKMYGGEQRKSVLVVDDDADLRMICREALEFERYRVLEAGSSREAFEHLRRFTPDLILLDLMLPDRNGFEIAQTLKSDILLSRIPIVFLTARSQTEDKVKALRAGGADYLVKPFDTTELGARIESILRRAEEELHASPTTKLPGSAAIEKEINRLLSLQKKFALCYLDIDHLKSYNDTYGYAKADGVVRQTGDIIRDTILRNGNPGDFAGHVAGDDFIFITSPEKVDELCGQIIAHFDAIIPFYYKREDRERGYLEAEDRYGEWRRFPLMSVSIACLTNEDRALTDHIQIATLAAEYKRVAKTIRGSSYIRNGVTQLGSVAKEGEAPTNFEENV